MKQIKTHLYIDQSEIKQLSHQFRTHPAFQNDRERIQKDLEIIYQHQLPPSSFSWWCAGLKQSIVAGQYQALQETLLTAHLLNNDKNAPSFAKEFLLKQSEIPKWQDEDYGDDIGHDLCSSHHGRAFAAGLDCAKDILSKDELEKIYLNYVKQIREPYVKASFDGNPYLIGQRNTNWLAHISGSVVICEIALAKWSCEDKAVLALAKANVMRYIDMINTDGSLPEVGDYFFYGVEFAILSLYTWQLHFGKNIAAKISQPGLKNSLSWPLAFTDKNGTFWADYGDTHIGNAEASRVVGYIMARIFGRNDGQFLGDVNKTREPLAPLFRHSDIVAEFTPVKSQLFSNENRIAINRNNESFAFTGGACRSPQQVIPHRHYDSGSMIWRLNDLNVVTDTGFYKYTATFWTNYDSPNHELSVPEYHNVIMVNNRGFQYEDAIQGKVEIFKELKPEFFALAWQLNNKFPGLKKWERQILLPKAGVMIVIDVIQSEEPQASIQGFFHLHETPRNINLNNWQTSKIEITTFSSTNKLQQSILSNHPKPCLLNECQADQNGQLTNINIFYDKNYNAKSFSYEAASKILNFENQQWSIPEARLIK